MTRPSPRPRPEKAAKLGVVTTKSPGERLTGVAEKPSTKPSSEKLLAQKQVTYSGLTFIREETPIAFEAAVAVRSGEGMVTGPDAGAES